MRKEVESCRVVRLLSENLRRFRKAEGMTQFELAEKADISENTLRTIELGKEWPSSETLSKIVHALGVEPSDMFKPEDIVLKDRNEVSEFIKKTLSASTQRYFKLK